MPVAFSFSRYFWGRRFYLNAQQTPSAQPSHSPADRCATPEYKQLDFILGSWEVTNKGKNPPTSPVEPYIQQLVRRYGIVDECQRWRRERALREFTSAGHGWQYFWVPSSGQPTWLQRWQADRKREEMQFTLTRERQLTEAATKD